MEIAYKTSNMQQLDEKLNSDKMNRDLADQERQNHINYNTNHDFYTENPVRAVSSFRAPVSQCSDRIEFSHTIGKE